MRRAALLFVIAACSKDAPRPEPAAPVSSPEPAPVARPAVPASTSAAAAPARRAPLVAAKTTPKIAKRALKPDEEDQMYEGHPPFTYEGLPAIADDGKRAAVIEERDGWGHTPVPGVRILELPSGKTIKFLPLVPGPDAKVKAANDELAKTTWTALSHEAVEKDTDVRSDWSVDGLVISLIGGEHGAPDRVTVSDEATGAALFETPGKAWARAARRCATPDLKLAGASRAHKLVIFRQQLGVTSHDCDSVAIPIDYRVARLN